MTTNDFWILWLCGVCSGLGLSAIVYAVCCLGALYVDKFRRGYRG